MASRRRELIRREIERHGAVRVVDLVELLGVSAMTVRRDIEVLAESGDIVRVHGGAALDSSQRSPSSVEPTFDAKSRRQFIEKSSIASAALAMIKPGSSIGITAGTTTAQLASLLADVDDLLVVTNSVAVLDLIPQDRRSGVSVLVTGGVRTPSRALVGPVADATLENLHLDQLFLGVHGMSEERGYSSPNLLEASTLQVFARAAESVVVLADHTKWGTVGLAHIGPLSLADTIITDSAIDDGARAALEAHVDSVIVTST